MPTIFITGAEGVGKSTILSNLKRSLPELEIHDFDERGVPENPPLQWRLDTTLYWIRVSLKNQERDISTCIIGLSFPEEIKSFEEFKKLRDVFFLLLDVSKEERERRLLKRGASKEVIQDLDCLLNLRKQFKEMNDKVIDTSNFSVDETSEEVIKYLFKKLK